MRNNGVRDGVSRDIVLPFKAFTTRELLSSDKTTEFEFGGYLRAEAVQFERLFQDRKFVTQHADSLCHGGRLSGTRAARSGAIIKAPDVGPNFWQHADAALVIDSHLE